MSRLIKPIFWSFLFLIMMLVIDQFFVQVRSAIFTRTFAAA
jgi:hypothetical protein